MKLDDKTNKFIKKAMFKHGLKYDYSKVLYKNAHSKVEIICEKHGLFLLQPNAHLNGQGCRKCGIEKRVNFFQYNNNRFIEKANTIHNYFYNYDKVKYSKSDEKVIITCPIHGDFYQVAREHLRGCGCPGCASVFSHGYKKSSWVNYCERYNKIYAYVYIILMYDNNEKFVKIGLTSISIAERFNCSSKMPYNYTLIKEIKCNSIEAFDLEKEYHKQFSNFKYTPRIHFKGYKECFNVNILNEI